MAQDQITDALKPYREGGEQIFRIPAPTKGLWGWNSPVGLPESLAEPFRHRHRVAVALTVE